MTAPKTYMDRIVRILTIARYEIESQCSQELTDDVLHWEEIARELLNRCYDLNLENLNNGVQNFPGIDLGDIHGSRAQNRFSSNKVAFSVL